MTGFDSPYFALLVFLFLAICLTSCPSSSCSWSFSSYSQSSCSCPSSVFSLIVYLILAYPHTLLLYPLLPHSQNNKTHYFPQKAYDIKCIITSELIITDKKDITNSLNEFFTTAASTLLESQLYSAFEPYLIEQIENPTNILEFQALCEADLLKALQNLDSFKQIIYPPKL